MKVNKSVLIAIGSLLWGYAAFRILRIGVSILELDASSRLSHYFLGFVFFIPFFYFVFLKVSRRYYRRIVELPGSKHYPYEFMNLRGYIMVAVMITLGILSAKLNVWNISMKGIFYISLGLSLFSSSLYYVLQGLKSYFRK